MREEFTHYDLTVTLCGERGAERARASLPGGNVQEAPLDLAALGEAKVAVLIADVWHREIPPDPEQGARLNAKMGRELAKALFGGPLAGLYRQWVEEADRGPYNRLARLALSFETRRLADLPWELMEHEKDKRRCVVRIVADPPQAAARPLELPLRVVQLDLKPASDESPVDVRAAIADVYRWQQTGQVYAGLEEIYRLERWTLSEWHGHFDPAKMLQPDPAERIDILHLSGTQARSARDQPNLLLPSFGAGKASKAAVQEIDLSGRRVLSVAGVTFDLAAEPAVTETTGIPPGPTLPPAGLVPFPLDDLLSLLRLAQVRLLVLQVGWHDSISEASCLKLSQMVAERGGPPVLVSRFPRDPNGARDFYRRFYERLVHDRPLDVARAEAEPPSGRTALTTGPGGEDLLRLSVLEQRAYRQRDEVRGRLRQVQTAWDRLRKQAPDLVGRQELGLSQVALATLVGKWPIDWDHEGSSSIPMAQNLKRLKEITAEVKEAEARLQAMSDRLVPAGWKEVTRPTREERLVNTWLFDPNREGCPKWPQGSPLWPHWTYRLHLDIGPHAPDSTVINPVEIPPEALAPLFRAGGVWLQVAVYGPDSKVTVPRYDQYLAPGQERPDSAMQQLWLPETGPSEPLEFDLEPTRAGLNYARICIYYRNQLLQALRLDARVWGRDGADLAHLPGITPAQVAVLEANYIHDLAGLVAIDWPSLVSVAHEAGISGIGDLLSTAKAVLGLEADPLRQVPNLGAEAAGKLRAAGLTQLSELASAEPAQVAAASGVPWEVAERWVEAARRLPSLGYETVIEYTVSAELGAIARLPRRAVSIFANDTQGSLAVGVKVGEWDEVWGKEDDWTEALQVPESALTVWTPAIRSSLTDIGVKTVGGEPMYAFGNNQGTAEELKKALAKLANQGYMLYDKLFSQEAKNKLEGPGGALLEPGQTIHVARLTEGYVLPWAILYSLYLDPGLNPDPDKVCLDLLQHKDAQGQLDYQACNSQADCRRKKDSSGQVVCPWGFWGIKHIIEQPPQQIEGHARPRDLVTEIRISGQANVSMNVSTCVNRGLLAHHRDQIGSLPRIKPPLRYAGDGELPSPDAPREQVLKALETRDLDVIYFYCHGGAITDSIGTPVPYLSVGGEKDAFILPANLSRQDPVTNEFVYHWPDHPLVFVNGCRTAALEPAMLGTFIRRFAEVGAAGVIGTEVRVWEEMATDLAARFLQAFLDGKAIGQILRELRHYYLCLYNPLGLVYTNFCSADLHVVQA